MTSKRIGRKKQSAADHAQCTPGSLYATTYCSRMSRRLNHLSLWEPSGTVVALLEDALTNPRRPSMNCASDCERYQSNQPTLFKDSHMFNSLHARKGFTLIELLIVVVIIGILAAI